MPVSNTPQSAETYDYVVVGGGSAGCVVAARLSEDPNTRVLLLEAGPPPNDFWLKAPAGMAMMFQNKRYNWGFTTQPDPTLNGRTVYWPRGKTLGGSSSINGMVYMRGHPHDFDHWAELGNEGWSWQEVLPYFKRSEHNARGPSDLHGGAGPMYVSDPVLRHPSTEDFIQAAGQHGIAAISELNAAPFEGISYQQFTIRNGRRESSYTAFIKPVLARKNLTVLTETHLVKVCVENGEATAVDVVHKGQMRRISVFREVILSGGALSSPHLLNLSGFGDGAELQALGIDTKRHLPGVGLNLQDHWISPFLLRTTPASSYNKNLLGIRRYLEGMRYLLTHRGYLAMGSSAVSAYVRSSPDQPQPDLQLAIRPVTFNFMPDGRVVIDPKPGISAASVLVQPKSTGRMKTVSPDPLQAPAFYPSYFSHPEDERRTLIGMRWLRRILATEPMAGRITAELAPGPDAQTDQQLLDHSKNNGSTAWHPVGTCKMGGDEMAVVDVRLRVHGVRRLRVVDASVMPRITGGNTHAPTVMIAEKASDMIKQDAAPRR